MKTKTVMSPKVAFVSSVLSLLLCISMFVGTTFAWYTESVSNNANHIMAGHLDVELEYYHVSEGQSRWKPVNKNTKLFDDNALWEPGYTQVVYLRVVNRGSLALKYNLGVSVAKESMGINVNNEPFKLSDYIKFGVTETVIDGSGTLDYKIYNETNADREAARDSIKDVETLIGEGYSKTAVLEKNEEMDYLTMVVYMPENVGNEANPRSAAERPSINLSIDLVATQTSNESDSFNNRYDDTAFKPVAHVTNTGAKTVTLIDDTSLNLETSFSFKTTEDEVAAAASGYRYWHADFVVSADRDVKAHSMALAGYYAAYAEATNTVGKWIALESDEDITANTEIRLMELMNVTGNYEELCQWIPEFLCGVSNYDPSNEGTTLTVELRLYETTKPSDATSGSANIETGKYVTIGTYKHAFGEVDPPKANVTALGEQTVEAVIGFEGTSTTNYDLDASFSFKTTEDYAEAQENGYRYWHADFVVSANRPIKANSVALAGYYKAYCDLKTNGDWVSLVSDEDIAANTQIRLLEMMLDGGSISYQELCNWVPEFLCGVADLSTDGSNAGTTLTVELRLYEVTRNVASTSEETGRYKTIGVYTHTFDSMKVADQGELSAAVNNGIYGVELEAGDYTMPSVSSDIFISGTADVKVTLPYGTLSGSDNNITFDGVTIYGETNSSWYSTLFNGADKIVFKDCVIYDQLTTYCDAEFINCTFYNTFDNDYSVYCYSGRNVLFEGCTFNTVCGKAVKVYDEGNGGRTVTVNNCTFEAENYKKAAVEIDSRFSTYYVYINDCTLKGAFTALWNSDAGEDIATNVCVDGTWVKGAAPTT